MELVIPIPSDSIGILQAKLRYKFCYNHIKTLEFNFSMKINIRFQQFLRKGFLAYLRNKEPVISLEALLAFFIE